MLTRDTNEEIVEWSSDAHHDYVVLYSRVFVRRDDASHWNE